MRLGGTTWASLVTWVAVACSAGCGGPDDDVPTAKGDARADSGLDATDSGIGGSDGGVAGAGASDAGLGDAGSAGASDTGAGRTDSGVGGSDAGVAGAGASDAGLGDAGSAGASDTGAGQIDSGVGGSDAGVAEAGASDAASSGGGPSEGGACAPGFADCNGQLGDGCEVSINDDVANCGGCGIVCSTQNLTRACSGGTCDGPCDTGFADCNGNKASDGCEVATESDPAHCGDCGRACPTRPHATATCTAAVCGHACTAAFADCNAEPSDGCEIDTASDPGNCGACARACSVENMASEACTGGTCSGVCLAGFADCNADKLTDGCETPVAGDVNNCGGCAVVCAGQIGRGCVNGVCNPTCDDRIWNQGEGDVDCGGPCAQCGIGSKCAANADCRTNVCMNGKCAPVRCANGFGLPGPPVLRTGSIPVAIATSDLDGDGKRDLAVTNFGADTVSVMLGQPRARFSAKVDLATGSQPGAIAIGDVDRDGRDDIIVGNRASASVSVLRNQGGGTFAAKVDYPTSPAPDGVALGDLDGDGKLDLVIAGVQISVLINAGGTFGAATNYSTETGSWATAVAIGDMNGDGKLDVVMTDGHALAVRLNQGGGVLAGAAQFHYNLETATSIVLSDVDGDGRLDVVTASYGNSDNAPTSKLHVFRNLGGGTLATSVDYPTGWHARGVAVTDLSGDGKPDVAVAHYTSSDVSVLVNDGSGAFLPRVDYLVGAGAYGIAAADFDGNGSRDLVSVDSQFESLSVLLNRGNAVFDARSDYAAGAAPRALAFGDLDGDTRLDLVTVNSTEFTNSSNTISVFRNTGGHSFAPAVSYAIGKRPNSVALGDFDGTGTLDIATANLTDGTVSVLLNYGNGTFAPRVDHPSGNLSASLVAGDLNADGKVDIAVSSSPDIRILFNRGNATFSSVSVVTYAIATLSSPRAIAMGDLNGDGRPDLARIELKGDIGGNYPGWATVLNQGGGSFVRSQWTFASAWTNAIAIAPLGAGASNSIVVANENNTVTAGGANYPTTGNPRDIAIGEVDGDGIPDLVVSVDGPRIDVLLGRGPAVEYGTKGSAAVAAADLDQDGRLDLAAGGGWNGVSILPNRCLP